MIGIRPRIKKHWRMKNVVHTVYYYWGGGELVHEPSSSKRILIVPLSGTRSQSGR
jgi:hypothetical protein